MKAKGCLMTVGILFLIFAIGGGIATCIEEDDRYQQEAQSTEQTKSLSEMLDENDFAGANKYLSDMNSSFQKDYFPHGDICRKYIPDAIQTLKAEASYLMDQDDPDAETLFMLCLNDVSGNIGNYQPTVGFFDGKSQTETELITEEVTPYNACLISIIREAIIKNKPDFAKKVFKMMKKNYKCDQKLKPGKELGYQTSYTYNYKEDNSQLEEAQKIISDYEAQQ